MFFRKSIFFVLIILLATSAFAQEGGNRFGAGLKYGAIIIGPFGGVGGVADLTYNHGDLRVGTSFVGDGDWTFYSVTVGSLQRVDDFHRNYVDIGMNSVATSAGSSPVIWPSMQVGWEWGYYRGLNFVIEAGFPFLVNAVLKYYF